MRSTGLTLAGAVLAPLLAAQSTGSISGHVTNSLTGAAIEGVKVHAACVRGPSANCPNGAAAATTDTAGAFRLASLPDANYVLSVEKDGFSRVFPGGQVATVSASGDTGFDIKLTPFATLRGRVVDADGNPVAGITVQLEFTSARTDDQGDFVFPNLSPSSYRLLARVKSQPDGKNGERLVPTYYPSTLDPEQAVRIQVQGLDLSGYEIRLRTAPARIVRGTVLDPDGRPKPHAMVTLGKAVAAPGIIPGIIPMIRGVFSSGRSVDPFTASDHVESSAEGVFEFPAVIEGDWILKGDDFSSRQNGVTELRVGRSDIDNVTLRLAKQFPIEVSPQSDDSQPLAHSAYAWVVPLDGQATASTGVDADAPFTQHDQGLPGRYLFGGSAPSGYYVSAALLDGRDVLGQAVNLSGPTAVTLVLKKDGGTLRGSVEKGAGSTVVLMADATPYARFGFTARCDGNGNFSIADVPPGDYTAVAFQDSNVLSSPPRDLLNRIDSAHGERITIGPSASTAVTLKLN